MPIGDGVAGDLNIAELLTEKETSFLLKRQGRAASSALKQSPLFYGENEPPSAGEIARKRNTGE